MLVPVIKRNFKLSPETAGPEQQQEQPEITAQPVSPAEQEKASVPPEQKPAASTQTTPVKIPEKESEIKLQTEKPATPAQPSSPQPVKPAETRGSIYLIQESNKMLVKVNRNLNANTPLTDSINTLLAGPTPDEIMRGIESLVPEGSRLLKPPTIIGSTVHLDFNQEFRYNTRGSEGCAAQIKQIVWTATEFSNVKDVQFLIEGQKVDFLSEGVTIRNPIGR
jgi:germination protein M